MRARREQLPALRAHTPRGGAAAAQAHRRWGGRDAALSAGVSSRVCDMEWAGRAQGRAGEGTVRHVTGGEAGLPGLLPPPPRRSLAEGRGSRSSSSSRGPPAVCRTSSTR